MRLGPFENLPCGCDSRREIMFTAGRMGLPEAALLVGSFAIVLIVWKVNQ